MLLYFYGSESYKGRNREGIPLSFTDSRKNKFSIKASFTFVSQLFHTSKIDSSRKKSQMEENLETQYFSLL